MQIPYRLAAALSSRRSAGMLLALGFSTVVLVSTPFLLPEISDEYSVDLLAASFIGVCQLGGFAIASWGAGRWLSPDRRVLASALGLAVVSNLLSALLPAFELLLALRFASGLSLGLITWFAWSNAFGQTHKMSQVAVVGPIIAVAATPVVALIIGRFGIAELFLFLAGLALIPLPLVRTVPPGERRPHGKRPPATRNARTILLGLTAFALGGSAVYTFGVTVAAQELDLSTEVAAIAYTANAVVSIPSAGWKGRRTIPSPWMAATAMCAFFVAVPMTPAVFFAAVSLWGFCYWMALPGVFDVLAAASAYPAERAGDAQALMAIGRVIGPLLGGALLEGAGHIALGIAGASLMVCAAVIVLQVRLATAHS